MNRLFKELRSNRIKTNKYNTKNVNNVISERKIKKVSNKKLIQLYLKAIDNKNKNEIEILYNEYNTNNNNKKDIVYNIYSRNKLNSERLQFYNRKLYCLFEHFFFSNKRTNE